MPERNEPGVVVTLGQIYDSVRRVEQQVGALHAKVGPLAEASQRHEQRIDALEAWRDRMKGVAAVAAVALPILTGVVSHILTRSLS